MRKIYITIIILLSLSAVFGQTFTDMNAGLTGVDYSSVAWGDYDNDGDLDILLTGESISGSISKIYRNDNGVFTDINAGLIDVMYSSVAWGDYDNDGDLDILLTGIDMDYNVFTYIYRNDSGVFTDINAGLTGVDYSSVAWGDYDNDGDLDILLTGSIDYWGDAISKIYRNDSGVFTDINAGLIDVMYSSVAWGDYDNDGDLDILITGRDGSVALSKIYRNDSGVFTDINAGLTGVFYSSVAWGDYDNDGDLDILLTGFSNSVSISKIYRNDSGVFTDINAGLTGVYTSSAAWGDYDNDGDLDVLLTGCTYDFLFPVSKIYRNDSGVFTDINAGLTDVMYSSAAWGDYDNDGDLDILMSGHDGSVVLSKIYRNNSITKNTRSAQPAGLTAVITGNEVTFSWDRSTDTETPQNGLSYNIYIGASPLTGNKKSPMSDISTGYRKVATIGNLNKTNSWSVKNLPSGTYYWSVQAVDNAYAGSLFGTESSFVYSSPTTVTTVATAASNIDYYSFTANWNASENAAGYYIDVAADSAFSSYVPGYQNKNVYTSLSLNIPELITDTTYYYRIRAYNADGIESGNSNTVSVRTIMIPFTDINASLIDLRGSSVAWGDYDNDSDLDVLITGIEGSTYLSKIYRNDSGVFTDINAGLTGVYGSTVAWGDYDNDGDLDLLITGFTGSTYISKIYRNDSAVFTDINAGLTGVRYSSAAWGDYDNDGDLDILLTGESTLGKITKIYLNDSGVFTDISAGLTGVDRGSADWGEYDNDGDLDILLTGLTTESTYISKIYRNDSGIFTDINAGLTGVYNSSVAWGDYDNDGDLDVLLTGESGSGRISKIYRNDSGIFTDISAGLTSVYGSSVAWGDYDNDGDLDILLTGTSSSGRISKIYRNDSDIFTDIDARLTGVYASSVSWGDYDKDGDLDILLTGFSDSGSISKIYRNNSIVKNTRPAPPAGLAAETSGDQVSFSWDRSTDTETPQNGLSYNLYIGTSPLTGNKKNPMSDISTGYRKVVSIGNTNLCNSWIVNNLPSGTYYWSVQALDNAYAGSEFSSEMSFTIIIVPQNVSITYSSEQVHITWTAVPGASSYKVYSSADPYGTFTDVSSQGAFNGASWSQTVSEERLFYYVVSITAKREVSKKSCLEENMLFQK